MLSEDMCQRNHDTGLASKGFQHFWQQQTKKTGPGRLEVQAPFRGYLLGENIYLSGSRARACNVPHQVYAKGLCLLLATLQKCCAN